MKSLMEYLDQWVEWYSDGKHHTGKVVALNKITQTLLIKTKNNQFKVMHKDSCTIIPESKTPHP